jgi:c-di-GMP-binding flagellar brake protein YcgR
MTKEPMPRDDRFRVRSAQTIDVLVAAGDDAASPFGRGELIDIARGGAKLFLAESVPVQDAVEIRLENRDLKLDLSMSAAICWCRPEGTRWALGCKFSPPLPADSLERLFATGVLERRFFRRRSKRMPVIAQWELQNEPVPAMLWDLSDGGFCLLMPTERKRGERVLITLQEPGRETKRIPAKIQWEMRVGEGYIVGCEFLSRAGYEAIAGRQDAAASMEHPPVGKTSIRSRFKDLVSTLFTTSNAAEAEDELYV